MHLLKNCDAPPDAALSAQKVQAERVKKRLAAPDLHRR
jgi:hypothetical protein